MPSFAIIAADGKTVIRSGSGRDHALDAISKSLTAGQTLQQIADGQVLPMPGRHQLVEGKFVPVVVTISLAATHLTKYGQLSARCQRVILSGFTSSALGSAYVYASSEEAQRNIMMDAISGGSLMCGDASGIWALRSHSAAQAQQCLTDFKAARDAARSHLASLQTQLSAATTADAINDVDW